MNSPESATILLHEYVTGGGLAGEPLPESWALEGAAMRRALAAEFAAATRGSIRVLVTLDPRTPPDVGPWETAVVDSLDRLESLARRDDYTLLIAPETSGVLEDMTRRLISAGCRLLGSEPDAVALTADKPALGEWLDRHGVQTPRSRVLEPGETPPPSWAYPAVVKPVDGAGSMDTFRIDGPDSFERLARSTTPRLLQEFVAGVVMSATFLVFAGRARLIAIGEQKIERCGGRFGYRGGRLPIELPGAVQILTRAVESVSGLRGLIGVDFIHDEERDGVVVLEINPRPTTSCVGLCRLLPPGLLADAWLTGIENPAAWDEVMDRIDGAVAGSRPVEFEASGRVWALDHKLRGSRS
ncbi:carbamoyl phosphate synthase-like protein [Planctomyces sp. SH-PL62]|nr:carbamoyl phosphate synthase-like protein [Planctomyces sp. SH-PL62]